MPLVEQLIGRRSRARREAAGEQVAHALRVRGWCEELGMKYTLNTVVNTMNCDEDMNEGVKRLDPFRWKGISSACCWRARTRARLVSCATRLRTS